MSIDDFLGERPKTNEIGQTQTKWRTYIGEFFDAVVWTAKGQPVKFDVICYVLYDVGFPGITDDLHVALWYDIPFLNLTLVSSQSMYRTERQDSNSSRIHPWSVTIRYAERWPEQHKWTPSPSIITLDSENIKELQPQVLYELNQVPIKSSAIYGF